MRSPFAMLLLAVFIALPSTGYAKAPMGYLLMCLQYPQECRSEGASSVEIDNVIFEKISAVNRFVNETMKPQPDPKDKQGKEIDTWKPNTTIGDCEDYVLAKRKALLRIGIPTAAMRIAAVKTRSGEGHALLIVHTSRGKLVLDLLTQKIRLLEDIPYEIVAIQTVNPYEWTLSGEPEIKPEGL